MTTEAASAEVQAPNYLEMSDADILSAGAPVIPEGLVDTEVDPAKGAAEEEQKEKVDLDKDDELDKGAEAGGAEGDEPGAAEADATLEEAADHEKDLTGKEKPKVEKEVVKDETKTVDFEAEYKRLLAPFKANGRDIQVESVDDAIGLMQMGANYNKKMAALKPNLKLMKMLENSGFMNEEQIGFLIDLGKKDPAAINKLVKESGIDPMDLSAEEANKYKPTTRTVDDREIDLDTALDEIAETPTYTRTLDIVSNKWDAASKQTIAGAPQLMKVINAHVESGIYDLIAKKVDSERVFGRLNGLTDIEAYRQVGDALQAQGAFNHLGSSQGKQEPKQAVVVTPTQKVDDAKLKDKKRAASSTRPASSGSTKAADFNPLALSDEEFSKLVADKFL